MIFLTALSEADDEERGLELGAVDYITKPIKPAVVLARVRTQLELKRGRDWLRDQNAFLEAEVARRMAENELIQDGQHPRAGRIWPKRATPKPATTSCAPRAMSRVLARALCGASALLGRP